MKNSQQESHSASAHQTVTEAIKLKTGKKTISITTTDQKLSAHAGQTTFWGFLHLRKFRGVLGEALPHVRTSPNALKATEIALGFVAGILAGADKLTRIARLRGDPLLPEVMEVKRLPSQSTLSRFLAGFDGAAKNLRCFRALWRFGMNRLPSHRGGYTLDLDSTALLHEDGKQEGVKVGYTRKGLKPCLHPLLAVLEEAKLVVQFWLRAGNAPCASNVIAFTLDLLSNLPRHIRLRLVRADSGFCEEGWLSLLESQGLALYRGGSTSLQTAKPAAQGDDLAKERNRRHRGGRGVLSRSALEPGAPDRSDPSSPERKEAYWRQNASGVSGLHVSGAGNQPASERAAH